MGHIKIFAKKEKEQEIFIKTIRIDTQGIGMEFGIENMPWLLRINEKEK